MKRLCVILTLILSVQLSATIIDIPDDYPTIQEGIDASSDGDTVLVADGQYYERISFYGKGILLSSELIIDDDTLHIQNTIIDADTLEIGVADTGSVVCFVNGEGSTSIIQGLTIQNGTGTSISIYHRLGGGIYCTSNSSPTIINNIIRDNLSSAGAGVCCTVNSNPIICDNVINNNDEQGIYVSESCPTIIDNLISFNRGEYGSGIFCNTNSDATISGNIISDNYGGLCGGGIFCRDSNPLINYNVIYANSVIDWGGGICCDDADPFIINNTISMNTALSNGGGVFCLNDASPVLTNNIIWANSPCEIGLRSGGSPIITYCDIRGGWDGEGNIDIDPLFLSASERNFNICSQSPCIDAGDPSIIDPDSTCSDIGVYYLDHPECEIGKMLYVSISGDDINGDGSPENPYRSIQHGTSVSFTGDTVLVGNGIYEENISVTAKSIVLTSNYLFSRDPLDIQNTIIDGESDSTVITFSNCDSAAVIEGFTIRNGNGWFGGGIFCFYSDLEINNNMITENSAQVGGGIYSGHGNPYICGNTIYDNSADHGGGGIEFYYSDPIICSNIISGNSAYQGGGICGDGDATITNNVINGNSAHRGGGIYCFGSSPLIINNTISENSADSAGGLYCRYSPNPTIINTVFWADTGHGGGNEICSYESSPQITFCDIQGGWEGDGNIDTDPLFRDPENGDFHLMSTACGDPYDSPCIDTGSPAIIDSLLDCDWGLGMILSDMGAYGGGDSVMVGIEDYIVDLPERFTLMQNYPNPFNPSTTIRFSLPTQSDVRIEIYNILGQKVATLFDGNKQAGFHTITWDADDHPSGVYFARLETGTRSENIKMVLLK